MTIILPKPARQTFAKIALALLGLCLSPMLVFSQITGGQHVFQFLSLSPSARITGLGGAQIAVKDDDLGFALANPAALNPQMGGRLAFNHDFYLGGIRHGYFAVGKHLKQAGMTFHAGLRYMNYGEIPRADALGVVNGTVAAGETAFTLGAGRRLTDRFSLGLNLHLANATFDTYKASALTADAGLMYSDTARRFTAGLVLKNKGTELRTFNGERENLPFDLQAGFSKRLRHLPFRFSVIAHHLHQWDIRYDDPNAASDDILIFGEEPSSNKGTPWLDNAFRHLIFSGEFLLGKSQSFRLRLGYNHLRKRELSVKNYRSLAGFSGGIGLKISRFRVDFGYAAYHLAGGGAHFSLATNLNEFFRK